MGPDAEALLAAGVADEGFRASPPGLEVLARGADHDLFGYVAVPDGLAPARTAGPSAHHRCTVVPEQVLHTPNVLGALAMASPLISGKGDGIIVRPPVFCDFLDIVA